MQAQYTIDRLEPPFWWAGMKNTELQIMVYGKDISRLEPKIDHQGVKIENVVRVDSPNYLFVNLNISEAGPGSFNIELKKKKKTEAVYQYKLLGREKNSSARQGFNNSDVIYLITPDRFANGNRDNDNVEGYADKLNRTDPDGRHGGDIQGVIDHLDYISGMGFTALWLNPVLENNMKRTSYHGYATTDYYKVDPRFGTNEDYKKLSEEARKKGIKLIMDMIMNHCGSEHWWMNDLPSKDWINNDARFIQTNHQRPTVQDPYGSQYDKKRFADGWFVEVMPDMNQRNPLLAKYLIQNSIWWIEYAGLSGIREDTYSYSDKDFMRDWSCAIMNEYPNFNIVGEEWSENPALVSYWQKGKYNPDGYTSCLPSLMDFPLQAALIRGLNEKKEVNGGLVNLYETLANDFQYPDPSNLVIFPDNHDMNRFYTQVNENFRLFKMGIAYILTMRGIPQIFYGTEILMTNPGGKHDGVIRSDFSGGWPEDSVNVFENRGLTGKQSEAKEYVKKLVNWRKEKSSLHNGKLIHYIPENGVYVYFRYNDDEKVMVAINKNRKQIKPDIDRFSEMLTGDETVRDVISGISYKVRDIKIPAMTALVLEVVTQKTE